MGAKHGKNAGRIPVAEAAFAELAAASEVAVVATAVGLKHPAATHRLFDANKCFVAY